MLTELGKTKIMVDYEKIAQGIYTMLQDAEMKGDESYITALAFGMLPAPFMTMSEKAFIDKLARTYESKWGVPLNRAAEAVKEDYKDEIREYNHKLALALFNVAKANNMLVV